MMVRCRASLECAYQLLACNSSKPRSRPSTQRRDSASPPRFDAPDLHLEEFSLFSSDVYPSATKNTDAENSTTDAPDDTSM